MRTTAHQSSTLAPLTDLTIAPQHAASPRAQRHAATGLRRESYRRSSRTRRSEGKASLDFLAHNSAVSQENAGQKFPLIHPPGISGFNRRHSAHPWLAPPDREVVYYIKRTISALRNHCAFPLSDSVYVTKLNNMIYSKNQWVRAINLSALLGWSVFALPYSVGLSHGTSTAFWAVLLWPAAIGMPIAFLSCWLIGAPLLKFFMRREITWIRAAACGGVIALAIASVSVVLSRYLGWRQSLDPSRWSSIGAVDNPREIDGILTTYGWLATAERTAWFIALGVIIALFVRLIIGRPKATVIVSE